MKTIQTYSLAVIAFILLGVLLSVLQENDDNEAIKVETLDAYDKITEEIEITQALLQLEHETSLLSDSSVEAEWTSFFVKDSLKERIRELRLKREVLSGIIEQ